MNIEVFYITSWWYLFFVFGVMSLPITFLLFRNFTDVGYGLSKTLGSLLFTYTVFFLAILKVIPLTNISLYSLFFLYGILNLYIYSKKKTEINKSIKENLRLVIFQEIFFSIGFLFWTMIRGFQPIIEGLEKYMDYGFINSILQSRYLPPADMWFAGKPINYYWFGHLWTAVLTKLSQVPSYVSYNLMIATILGLALTSAFSISSTLIIITIKKIDRKKVYAAGIISAILLSFAGNFHTPYYVLKEGIKNYWYPDATRFIGYNPDTQDKTIHEFPQYSFVVSDLHAHLLNFPFVLLFVALLLTTFTNEKDKNLLKSSLPLGFLLGVMFMTNTWDFANYLLLAGFSFLLFSLNKWRVNINTIIKPATQIILIVILAIITASPFIFHFESIAQGVRFVNAHSPLWQLAILWGFPALLSVIFAATERKIWPKIKKADILVASLLITAWVLIILPEIIYVKDIYIASHHRANTMFKLTYQSFVMSYLASGYITIRSISALKNKISRIFLILFFAVIFSSIMIYPYVAINSFYGELKNYKGLSGESWLSQKYPDTYTAILWLRNNVKGQPVILEAPGDSYTEYNVISAYTGYPTVSGWFVHEWLWRGDAKFPQERVNDITQIYTSPDTNITKGLLKKYGVEYVIVGHFERLKYPQLNEAKFGQIGTAAYRSGSTTIYKLRF
jgi:uncharacterized membrane protein